MAAWSLMGGNTAGLWMLPESQLVKQCTEAGLPVDGGKNKLIARLAAHRKGQKAIGAAGDGSSEVRAAAATVAMPSYSTVHVLVY